MSGRVWFGYSARCLFIGNWGNHPAAILFGKISHGMRLHFAAFGTPKLLLRFKELQMGSQGRVLLQLDYQIQVHLGSDTVGESGSEFLS